MLDQRFAIAYAQSVPQGISVLTQWFAALQERNLQGMADVMHFPFGIFEQSEAFRVDTAADLTSHAPPSLNMNLHPERFTDHDGYMQPGAYDVFESIETLCQDPVNCAMAMPAPSGLGLHAMLDGRFPITYEESVPQGVRVLNMTTNPERFTDHDGYIKAGSYDILWGWKCCSMIR